MRSETARLKVMCHKTRNVLIIVLHQHNELRGP
jgi:hypothetical protein